MEVKGSYISEVQHEAPATVDPMLVEILSWPRGHGTLSELEFCAWLTNKFKAMGVNWVKLEEGSMLVTVAPKDPKTGADLPKLPTTLFSCHVDTVDAVTAPTARKSLTYDPNFGIISLDKGSVGTCLGADDGAGVWIMLRMIGSGVPGGYLFHRGEERGGISAKANANKQKAVLGKYDLAVAFDRPRTNEIITHQGGMECASKKFATALCEALNKHGFAFEPSIRGVYTDTKEYRRVIAECVNVGVGYEQQHGTSEWLDYSHLNALYEACCKINWDALPVDRDPSKPEPSYSGGYQGYYKRSKHDDLTPEYDDDGYGGYYGGLGGQPSLFPKSTPAADAKGAHKAANKSNVKKIFPALTPAQELRDMTVADLEWMVIEQSDDVVDLVVSLLRDNARLKADLDVMEQLLGRQ